MAPQDKSHILFIADSLDNARTFQQVLARIDAEVSAASSQQLRRLVATKPHTDLVIFELAPGRSGELAVLESLLLEYGGAALLVIVNEEDLGGFGLPEQVRCDFVVSGASEAECEMRIRCLLDSSAEQQQKDCLLVDGMSINLATYQVQVAGEPVDLTYLEYALLAFLVGHSGRTFSRDALLQRVWGFDYYGGSRTVDVHVRRVRAKLGPELAQHLQTVRGVGYLWD